MAEIVRMPKLSDTMTEGVVAEWHKKVGDKVSEGDLLADIETDKATMEFESFYEGVLLHIGVDKGGTAPVNAILAVIGEKGENIDALLKDAGNAAPAQEKAEEVKEEAPVVESKPDPTPVQTEVAPVQVAAVATSTNGSANGGRIFASPLAKKMAEEKGINLANVVGSGENQRIVKRDIENYQPSAGGAAATYIPAAAVGTESYTDVPNSQMRKAIAKALSASKFSAPHFYLKMEVDMDNAIAARKAINEQEGVKISFNDMVVKAVAAALRRHPKVNADWMGDYIRYNDHIHVGVAVAVEDGLVVPVVKFTDTKGIAQIGAEIKDLAGRAREKKIQPEEMQGGTFAVSNLGMYGIEDFTSIINPPNGCILSVGQIKSTPVVKNGEIVPGNVMKLSLSCDHRVVDGAVGSEFLRTLKELLENPVRMLV
ncbi:pyruvate dehydrogenase complex dihydrolipoamide acetyltransferase [Paracrocinitomix mangrovi]|uniref:pyruvate dehydrogenase complex dihydrolipoamide acetyltransferase n=1 Tax=Paracrocinitomix mangrovi TaxID=2862509 RepID=UPI001C8D3834|nr:pyruvate dehydrogenase complex dihydrolipoamide acetyltransferase [Paracrocinitomix mangrovi]UKN03234.1 pyruvate dehydrogenase complex dihydrolipoamide acetyltransferase [Paracrocinitomix mangrovi]